MIITYVVCEASVNSEFAKLEDCIISICAAMASFDSILSQSSVLYIKKKISDWIKITNIYNLSSERLLLQIIPIGHGRKLNREK